jgi:4'-phosphopantetheinyl transferase
LSLDEKVRADRFRFAKDRSRFVVSHGALRELLGGYLRIAPASVELANDDKRKPFVQVGPHLTSQARVRFNASHSESLAVFAFSRALELGVDVEYIHRDVDFEVIAQSHFARAERLLLNQLSPDARREAFFLGWTRKEAYLKATGDGLRTALDSFAVSLETSPGPILLKTKDFPMSTMYSFIPAADYAGAVVAEGTGHDLRFWRWKHAF